MIYGYCRCSTNENKQDITRQIKDLKEMDSTLQDINIYKEYESGSKTDRVELNKLLNLIKPGDTILATEPSRITRSTKQLCEIIDFAKDKKIILRLGNLNLDCTNQLDPMVNCMLQMVGVFSELERNLISERVKSGIANAKAKGKVLGRPKRSAETIPPIFNKYYPGYKNKKYTATEFAKLTGLSRKSIYNYLKVVEN